MEKLIVAIITVVAYLVAITLGSLIFWGLGNLIIFAFHINFEWTFLMGLCTQIIFTIIVQLFRTKK